VIFLAPINPSARLDTLMSDCAAIGFTIRASNEPSQRQKRIEVAGVARSASGD
jgi:hypothetical protein